MGKIKSTDGGLIPRMVRNCMTFTMKLEYSQGEDVEGVIPSLFHGLG